MSYVSKSVNAIGVGTAIAKAAPFIFFPNHTISITSATEKIFLTKTLDFTDINYLLVVGTTTTDANATDHFAVDIGGSRELHLENAGASIFMTIDCTSLTGEKNIEFLLWNTTAGKYTAVTDLVLMNSESAYP